VSVAVSPYVLVCHHDAYAFLGQKDTPVDRVKWVLERLNTAHVSKEKGSELGDNTKKLLHKFMQQVETIF
jgi:hypothetical protein